jgi:hypothetical protein
VRGFRFSHHNVQYLFNEFLRDPVEAKTLNCFILFSSNQANHRCQIMSKTKSSRTMKLSTLLLATLTAVSTPTSVVASADNGLIAQINQQPLQNLRGLKHKKADGTETDDATAPVVDEKPAKDAAAAPAVDEAAAAAPG